MWSHLLCDVMVTLPENFCHRNRLRQTSIRLGHHSSRRCHNGTRKGPEITATNISAYYEDDGVVS